MPIRENTRTLLQGLSDFWQRFFADSDQLQALYGGTEILLGQAYLDMVSNVVNVSLLDAPIFNKEYWKLITIREDELAFTKGSSSTVDSWKYNLLDGIVSVQLLDNKVIEPTASLQNPQDFSASGSSLFFKEDPTDIDGNGTPLQGVSFRKTDIKPGGALTDSGVTNWLTTPVKKGNIIRLIDNRLDKQVAISDHNISVVRKNVLYVHLDTPFLAADTSVDYVILRKPFDNTINLETLVFSGSTATLSHTRLVAGSVVVFAKALDGTDVKENRDYTVDYEGGKLLKLTTWAAFSTNKISYSWLQEVYPSTGTSPRLSSTGAITLPSNVRVTQIALWAPDVLVDRETLYHNFGSLINSKATSSEAYRSFLRGVFQLYMLGPVLNRIESALNVILGFPVIRDDGEILVSYDNTNPIKQVVTTRRGNQNVTYEYPATIPVRDDVIDTNNVGILTFEAFEPLTTGATVTDYIQDPTWWHRIVIPKNIFATEGTATVPGTGRRTITPFHSENIIGPVDDERIGDPGFMIGADDEGVIPPPGHPVFRKKMAFVLFDRFLKTHIFFVKFDSDVFTTTDEGVQFATTPDELEKLVFDSKPAYTYIYVQPQTTFTDVALIADSNYYQPQRFIGADTESSEIRDFGDLIDGQPSVLLGLFVTPTAGFLNKGILADTNNHIGDSWSVSGYYGYANDSQSMSFPSLSTPVAIPYGVTLANRTLYPVKVFINATASGRKLVELVDYTVDYTNSTISRLTSWNTTTPVVDLVVVRLGNTTLAASDTSIGEMGFVVGGNDPKIVRAPYDLSSVDLFENPWTSGQHRDISIIERAITISY